MHETQWKIFVSRVEANRKTLHLQLVVV